MKNLSLFVIIVLFVGLVSSCKKEVLDSDSIFELSSPKRSEFDKWLMKNFLKPYNIEFKYRMEDIESDYKYNLVPATETQSIHLAKQAKYLWFDAYDEITGSTEFMCSNAPKLIHLIGSSAYTNNGSEVLGTAEGGLKITLFNVNRLDNMSFKEKNFYFFHTLHHEFGHILHQKINYPKEFEMISMGNYTAADWLNKSSREMYCKGFVSAYGSSEPREDFVEFIAFYVTNDVDYWDNILQLADSTYMLGNKLINPEELKGSLIINQKIDLIKVYLSKYWKVDLDELRNSVQNRTANLGSLDLDDLSLVLETALPIVSNPGKEEKGEFDVDEHMHIYRGYNCYHHSTVKTVK